MTGDIGEYCRHVEDYLTRVNGGHLVRIVGPGFALVRQWADEGIPLSVVHRGIDRKVERHHAGHSRRPVRIEFCEADVREVYDSWRRAVGLPLGGQPSAAGVGDSAASDERRRPSLTKHLDRAIERLGRASGRLDLPEALRESMAAWLQELTALREAARVARGQARHDLAAALEPLEAQIAIRARAAASPALLAELGREAEQDLASFSGRLSGEAWQRAVSATVDGLVRERFGLPIVGL